MVAIGLSARAVAQIRFAVSCLWEVATSIRVLRAPANHPVHVPWATRVRPQLAALGLVGEPGGLLWQLVPAGPGYLPDFLTPPPRGLVPDLDTELAAVLATPAETVRAQLTLFTGDNSPAVRRFHADPDAGLRRLATEIRAYWRIAIEPDWSRILTLLDAEVYRRARTFAEAGTAGLLNDLHERVHWGDGTVTVRQRHCTAADVPQGTGLVMVPSVFAWPSVLSVSAGDVPRLAFPVRGVAALWDSRPETPDRLGAVLGRGRARVLIEMGSPVSTTELARRTGITTGGVSQHLAVLRAAGLVTTHRHGRSVLNTRTAAAEALLSVAT